MTGDNYSQLTNSLRSFLCHRGESGSRPSCPMMCGHPIRQCFPVAIDTVSVGDTVDIINLLSGDCSDRKTVRSHLISIPTGDGQCRFYILGIGKTVRSPSGSLWYMNGSQVCFLSLLLNGLQMTTESMQASRTWLPMLFLHNPTRSLAIRWRGLCFLLDTSPSVTRAFVICGGFTGRGSGRSASWRHSAPGNAPATGRSP